MRNLFKRVIGLKDAAVFAYSMATCLKSGVSTVESLKLSGGQHNNRLKKSVEKIIVSVEGGDTLFDAFDKQGSLWPQFFIRAIRCGEVSGRLEETFFSLSRYSRQTLPVRENTRKIWFYPLVIITFGLVIKLAFFGFFFGLKSSSFFSELLSVTKLALLVLTIVFLSQKEAVKTLFDRIKLQIPLLREFQVELSVNQFFSYLLLLYSSNIDMITSVEYAADTVENRAVRRSFYDAIPFLSRGETIHKSLSQSPYIIPGFIERISVCEEAGRLDEAFRDITKKTNETSEQRMEIVYRTLFRILAVLVAMSVVSTFSFIVMSLGYSHKWYN